MVAKKGIMLMIFWLALFHMKSAPGDSILSLLEFHSHRLFDTDVKEAPSFKKKTKASDKQIIFPPCRCNWIHVLWKYFSNYVYLKDM